MLFARCDGRVTGDGCWLVILSAHLGYSETCHLWWELIDIINLSVDVQFLFIKDMSEDLTFR